MSVRERPKGSRNWYIKFDLAGTRIDTRARNPKNKKETAINKAQALLFEAEMRQRVAKGLPIFEEDEVKPDILTFRRFVETTYLPWSKLNKRSYSTDKSGCKVLLEVFGDKPIKEIDPFSIEKFKQSQAVLENKWGRVFAPASVNRLLMLLSRIFSLGMEQFILQMNPCLTVKSLRTDNKRKRYMTFDEQDRLLAVCVGRRAHLRDIILVAVNTGLRLSELLRLHAWQIDLDRNQLWATNTKNAKDRAIPLNDEVIEVLTRLKEANPETPLFPYTSVKKAWLNACEKAGIENLRFHDLRRTFATRLAEGGADVFTIKALLGHATINMAAEYTQATDQGKREAVANINRGKIVAFDKKKQGRE